MNFKRKRPKSGRAGCLLCKPHKDQRVKDSWDAQTFQEKKAMEKERQVKKEIAVSGGENPEFSLEDLDNTG